MEEDNERYVDVGMVLAIDSMKNNIKKLGQSKVLSIINAPWFILNQEQRLAYKKLFFMAVREMENNI